ncbi:MAG TPA: GH1 family beta-glucosidase [Lacunisphaera sp.]|jgi:beta-glucosidase|nr:GH1 family beta-glucosidase [Lacunisphaera sp.]
MKPLSFPANFTWGVSMAAPQIEGAAFTDGKSASVWDTFARRPGAVRNGDNLDVACDHYHRFDEDFALMRRLGVRHYRMSLAWPRIIPDGSGAVNQAGLDFYHRVFDSLERHGITPWVTMFHWDLPQALEDRGGWRVRGVADAFARYADVIVQAFGGRVKNWITLNEIFCFTRLGYGNGQKAPGARESEAVVNQTYHHALLCHGHGVRAVREHGGRGARVGLTDNAIVPVPLDLTPRNIAAARRAFVEENIRVLDPVFRGRYTAAYRRITGADAARAEPGDFRLISAPVDFQGLNIYTGFFVRAGRNGRPERLEFPARFPQGDCAWLYLLPQVLYWGPRFFTEAYGPRPLYITEHGAGYSEDAPVNGEANDLHRRECVRNYLRELRAAIKDGAPVKGYFLWSFLDNFEWEDGYERRFGIVHNDFKTQRRTPKLSAHWYSEVMRRNALV